MINGIGQAVLKRIMSLNRQANKIRRRPVKHMIKQTVWVGFFTVCLIFGSPRLSRADEIETYRRSHTVNIFGLSGFLRTNTATVLKPRQIVIGGSGEFENSTTPKFRRYTGRASLTLGLARSFELGVVFPYERLFGIYSARGLEASLKWNFLEQIGTDIPALAVVGTFVAPTGKDIDSSGSSPTGNEIGTVHNYGFKFLGVASADVDLRPLDNYIFGLFAEMGIFLRDLGQSQEEKHGLWGLGGVFPIGPVEFILEANGTISNGANGKQNLERITPALRYTVWHFSLTVGYEHTIKSPAGFADSDGAIVAASLKF